MSYDQALGLLRTDVSAAEGSVRRLVSVSLSQNQFDALVSFTFNVGGGAFGRSTLLQKLNLGGYGSVPGELSKYVVAGGRRSSGLVRRRSAEGNLFERGTY